MHTKQNAPHPSPLPHTPPPPMNLLGPILCKWRQKFFILHFFYLSQNGVSFGLNKLIACAPWNRSGQTFPVNITNFCCITEKYVLCFGPHNEFTSWKIGTIRWRGTNSSGTKPKSLIFSAWPSVTPKKFNTVVSMSIFWNEITGAFANVHLVKGWMKSGLQNVVWGLLQEILQDTQLLSVEARHVASFPLSSKSRFFNSTQDK